MCIIVAKPANKKIEREVILQCFDKNPDGAGISFVENEELVVHKGIKNAEELAGLVEAHMDKELVFHCRIASPGMVVDQSNCHPFKIDVRIDGATKKPEFQFAISHNGRLEWGHTDKKSDTHLFVDQMLEPLFECDPWFLDTYVGEIMLERTILHNQRLNKMAIMRYDATMKAVRTYIINKNAGNEKNGIWFSNYTWEPTKKSFFPEGGYYGQPATSEKELYAWWCEPDSMGWFWSYRWDAWINANTGAITRDFSRANPAYTKDPKIVLKNLEGRSFLPADEVDVLLNAIYMGLGKPKPKIIGEENQDEKVLKQLPHLNASEKHLLCKKAVELLTWEGLPRPTIAKMPASEKAGRLREWLKILFWNEAEYIQIDGLTDVEFDNWIIKQIKEGNLSMEKVERLYNGPAGNKVIPIQGGL